MRFGVAQPVLLLVIGLTACSSKPPPVWQPFPNGLDEYLGVDTGITVVSPAPEGPPPLSITAQPVQETKAAVHPDLQGTVFTIRNDSKKAVVVLRVEPVTNAGQRPRLFSQCGSAGLQLRDPESGELAVHPDKYVSNESVAAMGDMLVHNCFLLPGWSYVFGLYGNFNPYLPVAAKEIFAITYIATDKDYDAGSAALDDWHVYTCEEPSNINTGSTFLPFKLDRWMTRKDLAERWPLSREDTERLKILVEVMPRQAWVSRIEVLFPWQEGKESDSAGKQLAASLGPAAGELSYCYSKVLNAYLVRQPNRTLLYSTTDLTHPAEVLLPFPPSLLQGDATDKAGNCTISLERDDSRRYLGRRVPPGTSEPPKLWTLWGEFTVLGGLDKGHCIAREYVSIPATDQLEFLRIATRNGAKIVLRRYGSYELQGLQRP